MSALKDSKDVLRHGAVRSVERRAFLKQGLSLGALTLLTGCDVTDQDSVRTALNAVSRWNDRVQAALFTNRLMPTYPESAAVKDFRFNAYYGEDAVPRPISPYGITKHGCEELAHAYAQAFGLDVVVLRYFTFYGPRQRPDMAFARMVNALANEQPFELYGDGLQSRAFTYVADGVDATITAMSRAPAGAVYNVGGGAEATMREAIETLERVAGRNLEVMARPAAKGDVRRTAPDTERIERDLGWRATTPLEDGLAAQWHWAVSRVAAG